MGFLKEVSQFVIKYGEIALNKTEIFTQMVKVRIEIKKREMEIDKIKIEIGEYTIRQYERKDEINDDAVKPMVDRIYFAEKIIEELRIKLENIKSQLQESGSDIKNEKQA
jgi:hypothetical protein